MGGGGARAAYQVGFLRCLARNFPDLRLSILTGVSAGAINAAHLANHQGALAEAVDDLTGLWRQLTMDQVLRVDSWSLVTHVLGWGLRLISGGLPGAPRARGLVDTTPLRKLLDRALSPVDGKLTGVRDNLRRGRLEALAIATVNYATGQTITWVQGEEIRNWERPLRRSVRTEITVDHVMASAALPLFFPAIRIGHTWYGDGGIRQSAPLASAVHLGAERILAVSTRHRPSIAEADTPAIQGYPPPAQILGLMMDAVFLDVLDQDALMLERINHLLALAPEEKWQELRPVKLFILRPSCDLGRLAGQFELRLPKAFRFLTRGLGTRETEKPDWLSMVMFEPQYLRHLIEIGEADAQSCLAKIAEILA